MVKNLAGQTVQMEQKTMELLIYGSALIHIRHIDFVLVLTSLPLLVLLITWRMGTFSFILYSYSVSSAYQPSPTYKWKFAENKTNLSIVLQNVEETTK
jgi:hypothetical protein